MKLFSVPEILEHRGGNRSGPYGGHSQLYADIKLGTWPPLVKMGRRSVQPDHEVHAMVRAIVAGASIDQRRQLVCELLEQRRMPVRLQATDAAVVNG